MTANKPCRASNKYHGFLPLVCNCYERDVVKDVFRVIRFAIHYEVFYLVHDSMGSKILTVTPSPGELLMVRLPPAIASSALWVSKPPPVPVVELLAEAIPTPSSATMTSR